MRRHHSSSPARQHRCSGPGRRTDHRHRSRSVRSARPGRTRPAGRLGHHDRRVPDRKRRTLPVHDRVPGNLRIVVTASGFAESTVPAAGGPAEITLQPAAFFEAVNVTSSRTDVPRTDPTVTVTVLSSSELLTSAPLTLDDALKMVPGFTLFRRTSSRTANPTTQGVALRGIGGTAQSRSLVLVDGVPLNDAFGGWVYWSKVPQAAIDRVEVQRGSGSDLYGADAVGGVVQLLTLRPTRPTGRALLESRQPRHGPRLAVRRRPHARLALQRRRASGSRSTATSRSRPSRIPASRRAGRSTASSGRRIGRRSSSAGISGGQRLARRRRRQRVRRTPEERHADLDQQHRVASSSRESWQVAWAAVCSACASSAERSRYRQVFTTVNASSHGRNAQSRSEYSLDRVADWPASGFAPWGRQALLVGAEGRHVEGTSIETPYTQGRPLATTEAGGTQRLGSAFVQDTVRVNDRPTLVFGAHGDGWRSTSLTTGFAKSSGSFNPRVSGSYRARRERRHRARRRLSRIPGTDAQRVLSEFRLRQHADQAQRGAQSRTADRRRCRRADRPRAGPPRASPASGTCWTRPSRPSRSPARRSSSSDSAPTPTRSAPRGSRSKADVRVRRSLSVAFTSGFVELAFRRHDRSARDKRVPQVPAYNLGLNVRYHRRCLDRVGQLRVTGPQFEDDQNVFTLRRATVLDVFGGRTLAARSPRLLRSKICSMPFTTWAARPR